MKSIFFSLFFIGPALLAAQTPDSSAIKQVDSLVQVSRTLTDQRAFDKALKVNAAAENIALEKLGRESASYGKTCHNHGRVLHNSGFFQGAEKWYLEAIAIREKTLGKENLDYAWSVGNLGNIYDQLGNYEKAEQFYLEALAIREKLQGKEHPDYGNILGGLGLLYQVTGNYKKAEPFLLESNAISEKVPGKKSPHYGGGLVNLANNYASLNKYHQAEQLFLKAKSFFEESIDGRQHQFYVNCLHGLAIVYEERGNYEKAEQTHLEVQTIMKKVLGKEHPQYASGLVGLGKLYETIGNHEKAEQFLLEALAIQKKVLGKKHREYAASLFGLGLVNMSMGNYEKAEQLLLEALAIDEKVLGKNHPDYAGTLRALGNLNLTNGKYPKAEQFLLEAETIFEGRLNNGEETGYTECLSLLGLLYTFTSNYEKAEQNHLKALAIQEQVLGKEHPNYARLLYFLGVSYVYMGNYEKAEQINLEALASYEKVLGKEHPMYAECLFLLASNYVGMGNYEKAEPLYREMSILNQSQSEKGVYHLSERELGVFLNEFIERQDQVLSFAQRSARKNIAPICYDNALFYKGFLSQATRKIQRMTLSDPTAAENFNQLKARKRRLSIQYARPFAERDSMTIATLEIEANNLEKELARSVAGYAEARRQVKWQDVQATLKAGDAAIEFVHFKVDFLKETDSTMYAALVLLPDAEQPQFIPLFEVKQLDALLKPADTRKVDWVNQLYAETGNDQTSLYELLWGPLEPALAGVKTIYFSPSGQLHRLNLSAIALPPMLRGPSETSTLGERYRLIEVGSTRQLVTGSGQQAPRSSNQAMLFGGIQYEQDSTAIASANTNIENNLTASRNRGLDFASTDSTLRGGKWKYLPWTKVEVTALEGILAKAGIKATMRIDYEASEEAFKTLGVNQPSPRILHLATHGFFFPDPKTTDNKRLTIDESEPVFKMSDHPMIRSGLLMAGGNYAWEKGKPARPEAEDGILTAYEISQMNLSNTELVVLSACETGLGDIQGNEGVYGLQRAFKIAGAKYLIMSLWQVPDFQTQQLMSAFYRNWLENKMSIPDAFRAAQQAMQLKFKDPFFWAGFVLVE
jgi:CHAT domain-containing protein